MGLLLYIVAVILFVPLTIVNMIVVLIKYSNSHGFIKTINGYLFQTATDIDKFGNRNMRSLLNATLIILEGYQFGEWDETISSVLGKNQRDGTLTGTGKAICWILDSLDKDHCKKSIKEE